MVDDCYVAAEINVDALRHYRETARFQNWLPYLRTEIYRSVYEEPIWPKNLPAMDDAGTERVVQGFCGNPAPTRIVLKAV